MSKRIVTIEVTRYYSKTCLVSIKVKNKITDADLVEYLTTDEELDSLFEDSLGDVSLVGGDTTYEWQDPINQTGGTL